LIAGIATDVEGKRRSRKRIAQLNWRNEHLRGANRQRGEKQAGQDANVHALTVARVRVRLHSISARVAAMMSIRTFPAM